MEDNLNSCTDVPSPSDYSYEEVMVFGNNNIVANQAEFRTPIVFNQGEEDITRMACSRYGMVHIINAQNQYVASIINSTPELLQPKQYWIDYLNQNPNAQVQGATLQSALKQFYDGGFITGYATANSVELMKAALLKGNLLYTGSNNGDWAYVRTNKVYRLRSDNAVVGHCFCIVGFNADGWVAINSYGEDNGYFTIPYNLTSSLFTRYAVIDSNDKDTINNYKKSIMDNISIEDAKKALEAKIWNGENPKQPSTREEVAAMIYRAVSTK